MKVIRCPNCSNKVTVGDGFKDEMICNLWPENEINQPPVPGRFVLVTASG